MATPSLKAQDSSNDSLEANLKFTLEFSKEIPMSERSEAKRKYLIFKDPQNYWQVNYVLRAVKMEEWQEYIKLENLERNKTRAQDKNGLPKLGVLVGNGKFKITGLEKQNRWAKDVKVKLNQNIREFLPTGKEFVLVLFARTRVKEAKFREIVSETTTHYKTKTIDHIASDSKHLTEKEFRQEQITNFYIGYEVSLNDGQLFWEIFRDI